MQHQNENLCPCCSTKIYADCCAPYLEGQNPSTPEAQVRARYTAFALRQLDYVDRTHAPEIRADFNRAEAERIAEACEWENLHIHKVKEYGELADVEYVVKVRHEGRSTIKASSSRFRKENDEWLFISSKSAPHIASLRGPKVGRNDPCPCGSGIKFKKCCESSQSQHV